MIIIVFGLPGSGKTYFAERLAHRIKANLISSDTLRKEIVDVPTYSDDEKRLIYKKMFDIMYDFLHSKNHLVLDGTFYKAELRNNFIEEAQGIGKNISFIEIQADEGLIEERLAHKRKTSDADFEVYQRIKNEFEPFHLDHLVLKSTNENINEMLGTAMEYLFPQHVIKQ
ncbi:hypothetical protein C900_00045 [Fulvivirga imtechensis AK7]|uniref:ATP-binding protein n=1 Tax=Fulvivirga imtechensis AK7 TaxID=1237149 RepID=L8JXU9_9BACT|nr:ATP-binding protein [Fulvivirga imtechensis]ELR73881.1 hypothetical protein C900_00045 [Fulvivirga imtechensis AK7]